MAEDRRSLSVLATLLPAGALGLSISLASADAAATTATAPGSTTLEKSRSVASRLQEIRDSVPVALKTVTKEGEEANANDLLGQHLTLARDGDLPVRMVVMTSLVDASTSKVSRSFHVRPDLIGKLVSFDGDNYTVDFTRVSEDGMAAAPAARRSK